MVVQGNVQRCHEPIHAGTWKMQRNVFTFQGGATSCVNTSWEQRSTLSAISVPAYH